MSVALLDHWHFVWKQLFLSGGFIDYLKSRCTLVGYTNLVVVRASGFTLVLILIGSVSDGDDLNIVLPFNVKVVAH